MQPEITTLQGYREAHARSLADPDGFWAEVAQTLHWHTPFSRVSSGSFQGGDVKWFEDGELNLSYNCLDRHLATRGDELALIWESNDPHEANRYFTFKQLHHEVCRLANVLLALGVDRGDRVCLYMPMVPEAGIAMLACARIGAIHSVVFGGFSSDALAGRIQDCQAKLLITADSTFRGKKEVRLKDIADEAVAQSPSIEHVLVVKRTGYAINWHAGRDQWYHELIETASAHHTAVAMHAEDPLFILYTSGSTGKPKGVVHTTGGYSVYIGYTFRNVFQISPGELYWCTADVGWITGHSYLLYGPLLNGVTTVFFEGIPNHPDPGRFWQVVEKHRVTHFYTAPTAIRALEAMGDEWPKKRDLSSLRVLGTVGEPINQEAWEWYNETIGHRRCPIVDTWWQTETGGMMISNLAGVTPALATYATLPLPGIEAVLVDEKGNELHCDDDNPHQEGILLIKRPWPSLLRTTWGDHERYLQTYFSSYPGYYFTGDGARMEVNGNFRIIGRVDDVINVSGHRLGTAEVEDALNEHPLIVESAVVGYPHDIKGQGIYAYVIVLPECQNEELLREEAKALTVDKIGPLARPDKIQIVPGLPKTRSGKIMRRILRKIAAGEDGFGDTSTLLDPAVVDQIREGAKTMG